MGLLWPRGKPLRMVWKVEKGGKAAFLVGTAHFFPYSFEKALERLIRDARTVLLEGPLDEESHERVVQWGCQGQARPISVKILAPRK
jgi:hypothetical protein